MEKIDLKKEWKHCYKAAQDKIEIVDVPEFNYLVVDGQGNPNTTPAFEEAVQALYGLSYHIKFKIKAERQKNFVVMPLEGQWWMDDMNLFTEENKDEWKWSVMIMQPEEVDEELVRVSVEEVKEKKNLPALKRLRFERIHDGLAAQALHIGPYTDEAPLIEKMHDFIEEQGYKKGGKHREIYLSDPRRTAPEKLKTILRQPMMK